MVKKIRRLKKIRNWSFIIFFFSIIFNGYGVFLEATAIIFFYTFLYTVIRLKKYRKDISKTTTKEKILSKEEKITTNKEIKITTIREELKIRKEKKKEKKLSKEIIYLKSFENLSKYDMNKKISEDFMTKLKRSNEFDYESFIKQSGTTTRPNNFVVFDLETTGLSADNSEIIELGAIKFRNNKATEIFHTYIKPYDKIPNEITKINGITDDIVKNSPRIEDVIPRFIDFIGDDALIAHNSSFDMKFILSAIYHQGYKKIKNKTIDTLKLARQKIRTVDNEKLATYKLEKLKNIFNLNDLGSHNAIDDCKVCAYVYIETKDLGEDFLYSRSS